VSLIIHLWGEGRGKKKGGEDLDYLLERGGEKSLLRAEKKKGGSEY